MALRLDDHLEKVEEYGFDRDSFPLRYNGHKLYLLHNDARVTVDDRLQIHFCIFCANCAEEEIVRGRGDPSFEWSAAHVRAAKLLTLKYYVLNQCG